MSFFRRGRGNRNSLRPINRIKHVIDQQGGALLGVNSVNTLIFATDTPSIGSTKEVMTGSTVNGIYLKVEVYATTAGALANCYMLVAKNPGGDLTIPTPNAVGTSDIKRFVIHQEMVMLQKQVDGNPRTLFNGVIVIPRGYRRFGPADKLNVAIFSPGVNVDFCIQCHYKEFR